MPVLVHKLALVVAGMHVTIVDVLVDPDADLDVEILVVEAVPTNVHDLDVIMGACLDVLIVEVLVLAAARTIKKKDTSFKISLLS